MRARRRLSSSSSSSPRPSLLLLAPPAAAVGQPALEAELGPRRAHARLPGRRGRGRERGGAAAEGAPVERRGDRRLPFVLLFSLCFFFFFQPEAQGLRRGPPVSALISRTLLFRGPAPVPADAGDGGEVLRVEEARENFGQDVAVEDETAPGRRRRRRRFG